MKQNELAPPAGSKHKRKRAGRGDGSGHGTYSGRGMKGQKARSGNKLRPGFEGGQLPLVKRLPEKRGFVNIFRRVYNIINLDKLNRFPPETEVTLERLQAAGLVKSLRKPVKILGDGEVLHPLRVRVNRFSTAARRKIEAAGGRAEEIGDATKNN
ncbi:50S ribosomal protein L15 [Chloroflexota bacterium]